MFPTSLFSPYSSLFILCFFSFHSFKHWRTLNIHVNIPCKLLSLSVLMDLTRSNLYAITKVSRKPKHTFLTRDFKIYTFRVQFFPDQWALLRLRLLSVWEAREVLGGDGGVRGPFALWFLVDWDFWRISIWVINWLWIRVAASLSRAAFSRSWFASALCLSICFWRLTWIWRSWPSAESCASCPFSSSLRSVGGEDWPFPVPSMRMSGWGGWPSAGPAPLSAGDLAFEAAVGAVREVFFFDGVIFVWWGFF